MVATATGTPWSPPSGCSVRVTSSVVSVGYMRPMIFTPGIIHVHNISTAA